MIISFLLPIIVVVVEVLQHELVVVLVIFVALFFVVENLIDVSIKTRRLSLPLYYYYFLSLFLFPFLALFLSLYPSNFEFPCLSNFLCPYLLLIFAVTPGRNLSRTSNKHPHAHAHQERDPFVTIPSLLATSSNANRNQMEAQRDLHLLTDELSNACSSVADRLHDLCRQQVRGTREMHFLKITSTFFLFSSSST